MFDITRLYKGTAQLSGRMWQVWNKDSHTDTTHAYSGEFNFLIFLKKYISYTTIGLVYYYEIIFIRWTFNFVGRATTHLRSQRNFYTLLKINLPL